MDEVIKYDGTTADRADAVDRFYEWSAWDLAEELYDARVLVRRLLTMVAPEKDAEGVLDHLPYWATR